MACIRFREIRRRVTGEEHGGETTSIPRHGHPKIRSSPGLARLNLLTHGHYRASRADVLSETVAWNRQLIDITIGQVWWYCFALTGLQL